MLNDTKYEASSEVGSQVARNQPGPLATAVYGL